MLQVEAVSAGYNQITVLHDVSLTATAHEIVAVLGANGAGKSTLMRVLSGLLPVQKGRIILDGRDITRLAPYQRVPLGLVQVPEGRQIMPGLTVHENLLLGGYVWRSQPKQLREAHDEVVALFPLLQERREQLAGSLSGGEQQMLAMGRALMSRPRLLLLDEPSLGLAPLMVKRVFETIQALRDRGLPMIVVEQNARQALEVADRGVVLRMGRTVMEGPSSELLASDEIRLAYLGGPEGAVVPPTISTNTPVGDLSSDTAGQG